jgi:lysine N6-hydroxylase
MTIEKLDVAGIGVGPFNLSLAALLSPVPRLSWRFFERRPNFEWQSGMMLPGTRMQTSFLKDLVTPVDPTSRFGFLSYLVDKGRFYRFMNAEFTRVRRSEFADYMRWTADQIPNLQFGAQVQDVVFTGEHFRMHVEGQKPVDARDLVLATGLTQNIPSWAQPHLSGICLHSGDYLRSEFSLSGQRIVVVGGGQSGAEIFINLASARNERPAQLTWISRRPNLEPLDETPFVNEYFTPDYVEQFHRLPEPVRGPLVESQKLAGDGISPDTLRELSQLLYENDFLNDERGNYRILPFRDVRGMTRNDGSFRLEMRNGFDHGVEHVTADVVILATGYNHTVPSYLKSLGPLLARDAHGRFKLDQDYTLAWSGPATNRVYIQNGGRYSHGIADPQLSLAAWRAAVIANSVTGQNLYRTEFARPPLQWQSAGGGARKRELPMAARRDELT